MREKAVAILMFLVFCFLIAGRQILYCIQVSEAKAEMRERVTGHVHDPAVTSMLVQKIQGPALVWQNADEFMDAGILYDVIDKRAEGKHLVILCLPDNRETDLVHAYHKWNRQPDAGENSSSQALFRLINNIFLLPQQWEFNLPAMRSGTNQPITASVLVSRDHFVMTPPPWQRLV